MIPMPKIIAKTHEMKFPVSVIRPFRHVALCNFARSTPNHHVPCFRFLSTTPADGTKIGGTATVETETKPLNEETPVKKPMTFGRFLLYAFGGVSGATFMYYFYQTGYSLHRTEIEIGRKLAQLPLYWPPGPDQAEVNTSLPAVEIVPSLVEQMSAWFIYRDTSMKDGVVRSDVLDLLATFGLVDPEKEGDASFESVGNEEFRKTVAKRVTTFIEKGKGRLTEHKRQSGVSLQEAIVLLNDIIQLHASINASVSDSVSEKLHEVLGKLVEEQAAVPARGPGMSFSSQNVGESLPEVEVSDAEMLEMELVQLERSLAELSSKSSLSDAESARLSDTRAQIKEVKSLLR